MNPIQNIQSLQLEKERLRMQCHEQEQKLKLKLRLDEIFPRLLKKFSSGSNLGHILKFAAGIIMGRGSIGSSIAMGAAEVALGKLVSRFFKKKDKDPEQPPAA